MYGAMKVLCYTEVHPDDTSVHFDRKDNGWWIEGVHRNRTDDAWVIEGVDYGHYRPAETLRMILELESLDPTLLQSKRLRQLDLEHYDIDGHNVSGFYILQDVLSAFREEEEQAVTTDDAAKAEKDTVEPKLM